MPPELIEIIRSGGAAIAPLFAFLWWLERDERKSAQAELKVATEKFTTTMIEAKSFMERLVAILSPGRP